MTIRRWMWIFLAIGAASLLLAAAGRWLLPWPRSAVMTWTGIGLGYTLGGLLFLLTPRWWRNHCDDMYAQPAFKRYHRALWPIMLGYTATLVASMHLIKRGIDSVPLRALVAVVPAVALVLLMRATLRYLREIDELQRRIETEAIGIASLLVSVVYFAGGLLQRAQVIDVDAGAAMIWVFPMLAATYGIAKIVMTRRYL